MRGFDRSTDGSVAEGAVFTLGAQLATYALAFVGSVVISRALGPEGRGEYFVVIAATMVSVTLVHLSVESANTFLFAEGRRSAVQLAATSAALVLPLGALGLGVLGLAYVVGSDTFLAGPEIATFAIAAVTLPIQLHLLWLINLFVLTRRVSQAQLALLVGAVVQTAGTIVLFTAGQLDVVAVIGLYATSYLIPWIVLVATARDFAPVRPDWDIHEIRRVVSFGARLHGGVVSAFLLLRLDVFLVSLLLTLEDVGIYSLAVLLAELVWLLTNPLVIAALPFQSRASVLDAGRLSFRAARTNVALALVMSLIFVATLWWLVPAFYGSVFSRTYVVVLALLPGVVLMAAVRPLLNWLVRQGRPLLMGGIGVSALVVNVALNLVLLPTVGVVGAAVASSAAYALFAAAFVVWSARLVGSSSRDVLIPRQEDLRLVWARLAALRQRGRSAQP